MEPFSSSPAPHRPQSRKDWEPLLYRLASGPQGPLVMLCLLCAGPLVYFLQQVDRILSKVSPFAAAGIVVGTLYWSAVTYGAVTVMQVRLDVAAGKAALPSKALCRDTPPPMTTLVCKT